MTKHTTDIYENPVKAMISSIERHALHDGPGIRTLIFFKGCPLHCLWCSNPEGQSQHPEFLFNRRLCIECGRCITECPQQAISLTATGISIEREKCDVCGQCIKICPTGARKIIGKTMTVEEVMEIVMKDEVFYRHSGGGVTASGGEPLSQIVFLQQLFSQCKQQGVGTAIETCGYSSWAHFERILSYTDLFLYDIKHIDSEKHRKQTGVDNALILDNFKKLCQNGAEIIVRIPVVPGFNNSAEEIQRIVSYVNAQDHIREIHLLPYHRLGLPKYKALEQEYGLEELEPISLQQIRDLKKFIEQDGTGIKIEV